MCVSINANILHTGYFYTVYLFINFFILEAQWVKLQKTENSESKGLNRGNVAIAKVTESLSV